MWLFCPLTEKSEKMGESYPTLSPAAPKVTFQGS